MPLEVPCASKTFVKNCYELEISIGNFYLSFVSIRYTYYWYERNTEDINVDMAVKTLFKLACIL